MEYVAGDDAKLLGRLHRDIQSNTLEEAGMLRNPRARTQAVALLIEVLCLVNHTTFHINLGLQTLASSDSQVAQKFYAEPSAKVMQPVILIALVASNAHLDKTVMQPGKGSHVKEIDSKLPG